MFVYTVLRINVEVPNDGASFEGTYSTPELAISESVTKIIGVQGKDITIHGGVFDERVALSSNNRIGNSRSLGSDLAVSYKSYWGSYTCVYLIIKSELQ